MQEEKQSSRTQRFNGGIRRPLEGKRGAARHCSHSLAVYYLLAWVPNSLGKAHALLSTGRRSEARNRSLGMLCLGQATIVPSCAAQWAPRDLRSRRGQESSAKMELDLCLCP